VVAGGSMLACGGDERLELRTGAMSLSEDGLASTWDYAINNPLLTQQHGFPPWPPVCCPSLALTGLAPARAHFCAILEGPRNATFGGDSILPASKASRVANIRTAAVFLMPFSTVSPISGAVYVI
jgi:hypothetical protein